MRKMVKPVVSLSVVFFIAVVFFVTNCKFSFADSKKTKKEIITFGSDTKPQIKTAPQFHDIPAKNITLQDRIL